jgi:hypothetical protein
MSELLIRICRRDHESRDVSCARHPLTVEFLHTAHIRRVLASHGKRLDGTAVDKKKFLVLLTAGSISSLIMLDSNIVAVSLPSIARSMGGPSPRSNGS